MNFRVIKGGIGEGELEHAQREAEYAKTEHNPEKPESFDRLAKVFQRLSEIHPSRQSRFNYAQAAEKMRQEAKKLRGLIQFPKNLGGTCEICGHQDHKENFIEGTCANGVGCDYD